MSLHVRALDDPDAFRAHVFPYLLQRECDNGLLIGMINGLCSGTEHDPQSPQRPLLYAVSDGDHVVAAAARHGWHLVLATETAEQIDALVYFLHTSGEPLPGVSGMSGSAGAFAKAWSARTGHFIEPGHSMRSYRLSSVMPPIEISGSFRPAQMSDLDLLAKWTGAFMEELDMHIGDPREEARKRIERGRFFVWCDPQPTCMAGIAGPTPNGIRINFVFTPPELRRRGYASTCVATLSQHLLDSGRKFVFLYAETDNATSNRIYQRMGYEFVGDWRDYQFRSRSETM